MATLTIAADTLFSKLHSASSTAFTIAIGGTASVNIRNVK